MPISARLTRNILAMLMLITFAVLLYFTAPFNNEHRWKLPVRLALVVVACLVKGLDIALIGWDSNQARGAIEDIPPTVMAMAVTVFFASILLLIILPLSFFLVNYPPNSLRHKRTVHPDWLSKIAQASAREKNQEKHERRLEERRTLTRPQVTTTFDSIKDAGPLVDDSMVLVIGTRVVHPQRGPGVVSAIIEDDVKPYYIDFDNGEAHHYSKTSARKFRLYKLEANDELEAILKVGMRVVHPTRGHGVVLSVDHDDVRSKPYHVVYRNGEEHRYNIRSAHKLRVLSQGMKIIHPRRGCGMVVRIDSGDLRGRPYVVEFEETGEIHHYSTDSAVKLKVAEFEPDESSILLMKRHKSPRGRQTIAVC
jgi:hypothetical protein